MDTEPRLELGSEPAQRLYQRITAGSAVVGVVGLGYVGLPVLVATASAGYTAMGFDSDRSRIESLLRGSSYVVDVSDGQVGSLVASSFNDDPALLSQADVIVIAVPTPLSEGVPDLTAIRSATSDVARVLQPGVLVILESTTYPGTTQEVVQPILETSNLEAGRDFFLAYSPERIDPGNQRGLEDTPKIVGGLGPADSTMAEAFYGRLVKHVVVVPSPREAEMAKLIENTYRQVNIALVNELTTLAKALDVDIWASIEAAATKPFGFMPFWPGPGVGGHCIAVDPSYLSWRVGQRLGFHIGFVEHAKEVNNRMPAYVASRISEALNEMGKPLKGSRIMAIGLAYKANVNDVRESPAVAVMERLARSGALCSYHDPFVSTTRLFGEELRSEPLEREYLAQQDCVVILTAHANVDYGLVVREAPLVFDARGITRGLPASPNVVRL